MKKIFYFIASAIVALGAVACQNEIDENIDNNKQTEGVSFYAEVNDITRVNIGDKTEAGYPVIWEVNDELEVSWYDEVAEEPHFYFFVYDGEKFTCNEDGVGTLNGKDVTVNYYASVYGFDSSKGKKGMMIGTNDAVTFTPGCTINMELQCAFFHFSSSENVVLTVEGGDDYAFYYNDELTASTPELTGEDIWVPFYVWAGTVAGTDLTLTASIDGEVVKQTTRNFANGKIYNLGTIEAPAPAPTIGIVGSFQGWDVAAPIAMTHNGDGWIVANGVELYKVDEFKFVEGNSWDVSYGNKDSVLKAETDKEYTLVQGGQNIKATKNGKFDIYFNPETKAFKYTVNEEYTSLMVNITINNKANWSPLYITLKSGDTTIVNNAAVTGNKYAISGNYIGEDLSYTLSNGSKNLTGSINISKTGATITIEETFIKLKITLDTDNAKTWWGDTMKIHAWNTGTSFDTTWPGNNMTFEGNSTWSVIVPSELVGKTINYLVHNGNGWQSKDSKVTIKAEGNTVKGSEIGIN